MHPAPLDRVPPPLDTADQRRVEAAAERVVAALGAAAVDRVVAVLHGAGPPAPEARLRSYAEELIRCTALQSANSDPWRPRVHWSLFPGARAGLDNPDTRYRFVPVTDAAVYEIRGRRGTATDVSFQLFDGWQGDGTIGEQLGFLPGSSLEVDRDGRFTVTLDARPADGRPNHLQLPPGAAQVTIRDTLADWTLTPMTLDVVRIDTGPAPPVVSATAVTAATDDRLESQATFWPAIVHAFLGFPANGVGTPTATRGGLADQLSAGGRFDVAPDEALVLRLGPGRAAYFGLQLGSYQFISMESWSGPTSLNPSQTTLDADDRCTVVVSHRDPGWFNWLDPGDHTAGLLFFRWQGVAAPLPAEDHPTARVVPVDRVPEIVAGPCDVDRPRRAQLLARRRATAVRPSAP